jgi:hypothetical protein
MRLRVSRRHLYQRSLLLMSMLPLLIALIAEAPRPMVLACFALFAAAFALKFVLDFRYFRGPTQRRPIE